MEAKLKDAYAETPILTLKRNENLTQPARDVLGTSPEGPLKVLMSGTSR